MKSKKSRESRSMPAITLLSPELYHKPFYPRPVSPGVYRMIPPRSAKSKMSSFVILNEDLASPVQSRSVSPSGRVSPFRGHGFKSPATSRVASPSAKRKIDLKPGGVYRDIGLPPKSPKRMRTNMVMSTKDKPLIPPKPVVSTKPRKLPLKKESKKVTKKKIDSDDPVVVSEKKTTEENKIEKKLVESENEVKEKMSEGKEEGNLGKIEGVKTEEGGPDGANIKVAGENRKKEEPLIPCLQPEKCQIGHRPSVAPSTENKTTTRVPSGLTTFSSAVSVTGALTRRTKQIFPKAAEPNSPVPDAIKDTVETVIQPVVVVENIPKTTIEPLSQTPPLPKASNLPEEIIEPLKTSNEVPKEPKTESKMNEQVRVSSAGSCISDRTRSSSLVTVRAASTESMKKRLLPPKNPVIENKTVGDTISSTTIIKVDPEVEVLSPNNNSGELPLLLPFDERIDAWDVNNERLANGDIASTGPKTRLQRFTAALLRFLHTVFCWPKRLCRSRKKTNPPWKCCQSCRNFKKPDCSCCKGRPGCCGKPDWCDKLSCFCCLKKPQCKKLKCCEGKCCKRKGKKESDKNKAAKKEKRLSCCAKIRLSCSSCRTGPKPVVRNKICNLERAVRPGMKECCWSCCDKFNGFCRSLFCLNLLCCQRCLKKCTCCHRLGCCKKGGCCSCCNPHVKREPRPHKLDKKASRVSNNQPKTTSKEREKLEPGLVEHASVMKAAIPVLPFCLAVLCLIFNMFIPGSGTFFSGIFCLCFGKPRFSVNDSIKNRVSSFFVNLIVAVSQFFTMVFCLVGWGWSIWWGVIMIKLSRKQKRLRLTAKESDTTSSTNQNHVDVERGV